MQGPRYYAFVSCKTAPDEITSELPKMLLPELGTQIPFTNCTGGQRFMLTPKVNVIDEGNVRVLTARGEFVGGNETDDLREGLAKEGERGTERLLIDLEGVTYLNSSALGVLISAHSNFSKRGSLLGLCNVSQGINNIFVITKLSLVFKVYESRAEGVAALSQEQQ